MKERNQQVTINDYHGQNVYDQNIYGLVTRSKVPQVTQYSPCGLGCVVDRPGGKDTAKRKRMGDPFVSVAVKITSTN